MNESKKIIDLKKKRDGSLVLVINFNLIQVLKTLLNGLFNFVSWLDNLARFSFLMMFIGSIGLGFGMGVIVFSNPDLTLASNFFQDKKIQPKQIQWMDVLYLIEEKTDPVISLSTMTEVFWQSQYDGFGQGHTIVLYSHELPLFEQTALGAQIKLIGQNDGIYNYAVTQIQITDRKDLPNIVQSNNDSLVIYQSDELFGAQLLVAVAKLQN